MTKENQEMAKGRDNDQVMGVERDARGDGAQNINNTLNWKKYYARLVGGQIHGNLCYHASHETIWLRKSKLVRVQFGEKAPQNHCLTAVAKVAA
ncbi:MAG: hypothetical protein KKF43_12785 [Proteobacteria bacterium]|nr:hypothetical protein [Pseudomonadota bacterium]